MDTSDCGDFVDQSYFCHMWVDIDGLVAAFLFWGSGWWRGWLLTAFF